MEPVSVLSLVVVLAALGTLALVGGAVVYARYRAASRDTRRAAEKLVLDALLAAGDLPRSSPLPAYVVDPTYPKPCSDCRHFDLEEGQAMKRAHHAFDEVSRWIPPADMNKGNRELDYNDPLRVPQKAQWSEYGACGKRQEQVWGPWSAEKRRLTILRNEDGTEGPDCWEPRETYPRPGVPHRSS